MTVDTPATVAPESNTAWPWDTHPLAILYFRCPNFYKFDDNIKLMEMTGGYIENASARFCFNNDQMIIRIEANSVPSLITFGWHFTGYTLSLTLNGPAMSWEDLSRHLSLLDECVKLISQARTLLKSSMTDERKGKFIELYQGLFCLLRHSKEMQFRIRMLNLSVLQLSDIDPPADMPTPLPSDLKDGFIALLNDMDPNWRNPQTEAKD